MVPEVRVRLIDWPTPTDATDRDLQKFLGELKELVKQELLRVAQQRYVGADIVWDTRVISRADAELEFESQTIFRSKDIFYCLVLDPTWEPGPYNPDRLVLTYLESRFVWLPFAPGGLNAGDCPDGTFMDKKGAASEIVRFLLGDRSWFDRGGVRWKIRNPEGTSLSTTALIVEDEPEYADMIGYVAYRTGRFGSVDVITSECRLSQVATQTPNSGKAGILVHSLNSAFPDRPRGDNSRKWSSVEEWASLATHTGLWRCTVSSACKSETVLVHPAKWKRQDDPLGMDGSKVRGVRKPLGWIHDILCSGLLSFNAQSSDTIRSAVYTTFSLGSRQRPQGEPITHSAAGWAQAIAQDLLFRSRAALAQGEPLLEIGRAHV